MSTPKSSISVTEFKTKCLEILREVQEDHVSYVITKHNKVVAEVHPVKTTDANRSLLLNSIIFESDLISPIEESWEAEN